jgi:hypothetical protein
MTPVVRPGGLWNNRGFHSLMVRELMQLPAKRVRIESFCFLRVSCFSLGEIWENVRRDAAADVGVPVDRT